jgi:hypothetical protein
MLAAGGTAACDNDDEREDGHFYCANEQGQVVDSDRCDEDSPNYSSSTFIYYMGSSLHTPPNGYSTYHRGTTLPAGAAKFKANDVAARQRFGLPAKGAISNGTVKTGVVGKGGAGSKAGSGGKAGG